ncbi:hypothetical protein GTQ34_06250 [Muricauda sp. JGD-17]|uniref:DoxX family protein n=1 Tax=Flagellimonas ochracea TaxID=2696472 RepID=A0A964TAX3_9FLAO|nr:hypothetical protein [Allomuricauda ochracea]
MYLKTAIIFSALSFLFFGYACLTSPFMVLEFKRYGLARFRELNGYLQMAGGLSLLLGLYYQPLLIIGSSGLSVLMFFGLLVRFRLKDGFLKSLPAFFYMLLNVFILWACQK